MISVDRINLFRVAYRMLGKHVKDEVKSKSMINETLNEVEIETQEPRINVKDLNEDSVTFESSEKVQDIMSMPIEFINVPMENCEIFKHMESDKVPSEVVSEVDIKSFSKGTHKKRVNSKNGNCTKKSKVDQKNHSSSDKSLNLQPISPEYKILEKIIFQKQKEFFSSPEVIKTLQLLLNSQEKTMHRP